MNARPYVIGEALAELRKLPDRFAQTCVTSPPYWNLRDYGTGAWEGGDEACDHLAPAPGGHLRSGLGKYDNALNDDAIRRKIQQRQRQYRQECARCGALRVDQQLGLEPTPEAYVARVVEVFREVRRVLRDDGTLWINLGDSYAGSRCGSGGTPTVGGGLSHQQASKVEKPPPPPGLKSKDLVGVPWRVALALQADGWYLRSDIIWAKPNPMPESVTDRPTKAHEYLFLLSKSARYYYDARAIREQVTGTAHPRGRTGIGPKAAANAPGSKQNSSFSAATKALVSERNKRSVWRVASQPYSGAHFACFPPKLIEPCILAGAPLGGMVLDPFLGSGTTGMVAEALGRKWFGIELNPTYERLIKRRTRQRGLFVAVDPTLQERPS